jgi:hypothetical protein
MTFIYQKHDTETQKKHRSFKYKLLREIAKCSVDEALVYRDWTDNKVLMILKGEAKPIPKWSNGHIKSRMKEQRLRLLEVTV